MNLPKKVNYIEIIKPLGAGGTAEIYIGVDLNSGSLVAVKVLFSKYYTNQAIREKLHEEANHYLYLTHPGIVRLKDFIIKSDAYYLIMEYVQGQNLEKYISKITGPIPEQKAVVMMIDILDAIGYAHNQNVLHLDIKPSNIMLTDNGEIKILDFGISAEVSKKGENVAFGAPVGTPYYMSPEQTTGLDIDLRSDIYSLGITLFQMVTGSVPFIGDYTRDQVFKKICDGDLPKATEFYPAISSEIQGVIDTATAVKKKHRFQSAEEFKSALLELKT